MYFTGFADEAAKSLDGQIKATKQLGWGNIEARSVDGTNILDLSDEDFDVVAGKLSDAGVKVNCFGSTIANWATQITDDFDVCIAGTKRAIPRMQRLGTKLIRIMSYARFDERSPKDQMQEERFRRLRELKLMFDDAGIIAVHENCMNYGGMSYSHTLKLIENVPGLRLVFDTGNPVFNDDRSKEQPYPKQSSWEFYSNVKEYISYIHIKDCKWDAQKKDAVYCYPGEGDGDVEKILTDFISSGYDGGISIEPHLVVVFHDDSSDSTEPNEEVMFSSYVEYGERLKKIVAEIINNKS